MIERAQKFSARRDGVVVEELDGEMLVYDRRTDVAHCLNEVAAVAWRTCEDGATVKSIAKQIVASGLASSLEDATGLADVAVTELGENGLLEETGTPRLLSERVPRRQALRRIAGVGMAAATGPLVLSVAVPNAWAGASTLPKAIYYSKTFGGTVYYFELTPNYASSTNCHSSGGGSVCTNTNCAPIAHGSLPSGATCKAGSSSTYTDCSDVNVVVSGGSVTVSSTDSGEVPDATQSFMLCGTSYLKPVSSSGGYNGQGQLTFSCPPTTNGGNC